MPRLQIKRGTRAQIEAAAAAGQLLAGEPYLITDEGRLAAGLTSSTFETYARTSETGGASTPYPRLAGTYVDSAHGSSTTNTRGLTAGRIDLGRWSRHPVQTDQLRVSMTTAAASGNGIRLLVYAAGADGWPDALVYDSGEIAADVTGARDAEPTEPLLIETGMWVGLHVQATCTVRTIPVGSVEPFAVDPTSTTYGTRVERAVAWASGPPETWGTMTAAQIAYNSPPISLRLRVA